MDLSEREETTKYARERIDTYLKNDDFISALLLASIYLNIRLKSLLADRLSPPKAQWRKTSRMLDIGFNRLVNLCNQLGLLKHHNPKNLKKLWDKRCKVAHESKLWRGLSQRNKEDIDRLCRSAIEFLEKTT